jgi:hypothetical protein
MKLFSIRHAAAQKISAEIAWKNAPAERRRLTGS